METMMLRAIWVVAILLVVLVLVYVGLRVREASITRRMFATLDDAEKQLAPFVFTGSGDYDRQAAALLAQVRCMRNGLQTARNAGQSVLRHRQMVASFADGLELFMLGDDVLAPQRGAILKGYVSEIDGSLQTYSVYVPGVYDDNYALPLVVSLHGHAWFAPFQGHPAPAMAGAFVLSPDGRGATDFMWIGEEDVLRAIEEVKRAYHIDERRIFIMGTSMGGTGAWNVAAHNPHLFAGVAPRAANCDFHAWQERWGWNKPLDGQHREIRDWLIESDSPVTYLANLAQTPVYVTHNSADPVVPVEHARGAVEKLRAAGGAVEYREFFAGLHGDLPDYSLPEQLGWLAGRARIAPPTRYRYETRDARHGRSYYATIEQLDEVMKPAVLDVRLDEGRLDIDTKNVLALTVHPAEMPLAKDAGPRSLTFRLDRQAVPLDAEAGVEHYVRSGALWRHVDAWPPDNDLRKVRGLEGPVQDAFLSPFTVVVGTGGPDQTWFKAAEAEAWRFVVEWIRRLDGRPTVIPDTMVTDQMLAGRNIVFFGWPNPNFPMKKVLDGMPVHVSCAGGAGGGAVGTITVAGERFQGDDLGAIYCYPTPRPGPEQAPGAPRRMTVVYTACSPGAIYQVHMRFGNWFNWGVYDCRKWFDYAVFDAKTANPETYPVVGFFGTDWSFERGRSWHPTAEALARAKPQGVPKFASPPDVDVLYLSDLKPTLIEQMRGAVAFDRSFRGNAITILGHDTYERGLGVRCPSKIEFPIDGRFRRFSATVGFTREPEEAVSVPRRGSERANVVVLGDGRALFTTTLSWLTPVMDVDVDVTGVRRLTLELRAGGPLWLHGSSAWADAKVQR